MPEAAAEACGEASGDRYAGAGRVTQGWKLVLHSAGGERLDVDAATATAPGGGLALSRFDRAAQEDALRAVWDGSAPGAALSIGGRQLDLTRQANGDLTLLMEYRLEQAPTGQVLLGVANSGAAAQRGMVDITSMLGAPGEWNSLAVRLSCFGAAGADLSILGEPFVLQSTGRLNIGVSAVRLAPAVGAQTCPPAAR